MFKTVITSTPYTTAAADGYFHRIAIAGMPLYGDMSIVATLRALLYKRMPAESTLLVYHGLLTPPSGTSGLTERYLNRVFGLSAFGGDGQNQTALSIYNASFELAKETLDYMHENLHRVCPGFHEIEKVNAFYKKVFEVRCFVNEDSGQSVLIVDHLNLPKYHLLQSGILAYIPWFFKLEDGITDDERALLESLRKPDPADYLKILDRMVGSVDLRSEFIRSSLDGFEDSLTQEELNAAERNMNDINQELDRLNAEFARILTKKRHYEALMNGLMNPSVHRESALMEYFLGNKNLILRSFTNDNLVFSVLADLQFFDEDAIEEYLGNPRSIIYLPRGRSCENIIPHDDMRRLFSAVFIDRRVKVKLCATYSLSTHGRVAGLSGQVYGQEYDGRMPNPHINSYSCLGDYAPAIQAFVDHYDYVGAVNQCEASCRSINVNEHATMSVFMDGVYGINGVVPFRCFELPDGRILTAKEAAAALREIDGVEEECA